LGGRVQADIEIIRDESEAGANDGRPCQSRKDEQKITA
jgi:hypothetical protein